MMRGPERHSLGLKNDELVIFGVVVKYCTDVQHM